MRERDELDVAVKSVRELEAGIRDNVELIDQGLSAAEVVDGGYGEGRYIRQALHNPPRFDDNYVIVGSWVVGEEPAGISLREDQGRITRNTSRFVPHFIRD